MPIEQEFLITAFKKIAIGEAITTIDFNRIIKHFSTVPILVENPTTDTIQSHYAQFRATIHEKYAPVEN